MINLLASFLLVVGTRIYIIKFLILFKFNFKL